MSFVNGVYSLPAGYAIPIVANSALGQRWSYDTMHDIEQSISGIITAQPLNAAPAAGDFLLSEVAAGTSLDKITITSLATLLSTLGVTGLYVGSEDRLTFSVSVPVGAEYMVRGPLVIPAGKVFTVPAGAYVRIADWEAPNSTVYSGTFNNTGTLGNTLILPNTEYLVRGPVFTVPAGHVCTIQAGGLLRVADWQAPNSTVYSGTFNNTGTLGNTLVLPNTEYLVRGPVFTVPAGLVCTVQAGGLLRVADWQPIITAALSSQILGTNYAIPPGFMMNKKSFGTLPFQILPGVTLTIPPGAVLLT